MNIDRSESKDFEVSEACMRYQGLYITLLRAKDYLWGVPAGKLEFRETPLGGIVPEIRAEIGLQIFPKYVTTISQISRV